jgi:hypothetical protein
MRPLVRAGVGRRVAAAVLGGVLTLALPAAASAHGDHDRDRDRDSKQAQSAHREDRGGRFSREFPGDERSRKEEHSGGADDDCHYSDCEFNDCSRHVDNCER